jgi:hypothetical protein
MGAIAGRARRDRTYGQAWVFLQTRVSPEVRERAHRGAAARGVSMSRYMEMLIEADELADAPSDTDCGQLDLGLPAA